MATRNLELPHTQRLSRRAKIIPISGELPPEAPEVESDYKVMVVSDLHINRIYRKKNRNTGLEKEYFRFGTKAEEGFFRALKGVNELVITGDMFDIDDLKGHFHEKRSDGYEPSDNIREEREWNRSHPREFLEDLLRQNPHLKVTYLMGNHDGMWADRDHIWKGEPLYDRHREYISMLEELRREHPDNFSFDDAYTRGNFLAFHGHSHIEYRHRSETDDNHRFFVDIYKKEANANLNIRRRQSSHRSSLLNMEKRAAAIARTDLVESYIESRLTPETTGRDKPTIELYVAHGHDHHRGEYTIKRGKLRKFPNVELHVTDLGCVREPNYKIYHFSGDQVQQVEDISLSAFARKGSKGEFGKDSGSGFQRF